MLPLNDTYFKVQAEKICVRNILWSVYPLNY